MPQLQQYIRNLTMFDIKQDLPHRIFLQKYNKRKMANDQMLEYLKNHSCKQFKEDLQKINLQLDDVVKQAEKLLETITSIELNWMDSVFRPDNEKRKRTVMELLKSIVKKTFVLAKYLEKEIPSINEEQYERMRVMCNTTFDLKKAGQIWEAAGIAFGLVVSFLAFLAGGPIAWASVITIYFGAVGLILGGLAVHERYTKLQELIKQLVPFEKKISEAYQALGK